MIVSNNIIHGDAKAIIPSLPYQYDCIIMDPPYNIRKDFGNDSDNQSHENHIEWLTNVCQISFQKLSPKGLMFIYGYEELLAHISVNYPINRQRWLCWSYTNKVAPLSKFFQKTHESILCLWKNDRPILNINKIRVAYGDSYHRLDGKTRARTLGRMNLHQKESSYNVHPKGALPRDVISVPALSGMAGYKERIFYCPKHGCSFTSKHKGKHERYKTLTHPTQKPMKLTEILIKSCTKKYDAVLVPFSGSGSECIVAFRLKRLYTGIEINENYVLMGRDTILEERLSA